MTNDFLQTKISSGIAKAWLNRPDSFNSLNGEVLDALRHFVQQCGKNPDVRCIAIGGAGKAFCSGQNLKEALHSDITQIPESVKKMVTEHYNPLVLEITNCPKPVVALVHGTAAGAGALLALICDICVAAESATLAMSFVNIGLVPDSAGTYFLPKLLGRQMASYLAFTGENISAKEAQQLGLFAKVFQDGEFEQEAHKLLLKLAAKPTAAIALTKKAFALAENNSLEKQLELEAELQSKAAQTSDFQEGLRAFAEKRKPNFTGK